MEYFSFVVVAVGRFFCTTAHYSRSPLFFFVYFFSLPTICKTMTFLKFEFTIQANLGLLEN